MGFSDPEEETTLATAKGRNLCPHFINQGIKHLIQRPLFVQHSKCRRIGSSTHFSVGLITLSYWNYENSYRRFDDEVLSNLSK